MQLNNMLQNLILSSFMPIQSFRQGEFYSYGLGSQQKVRDLNFRRPLFISKIFEVGFFAVELNSNKCLWVLI